MNSSSVSLTYSNIHAMHENITPKTGSKLILHQAHRKTSRLRARSFFKFGKDSTPSDDENKSIVTSFTHKLIPLVSHVSNMIASYSTNINAKYLNPPLPPSVDPKKILTGNFASVGETRPTECSVVQGELPPSLNGAYIRNGPNPQYMPVGPYHLWSGDGMLHSIRLSNGRAIYCNRFVKTRKYEFEKIKGFPIIPNVISGFYGLNDIYKSIIGLGSSILGGLSIVEAFGIANTSLAYFHGKLFAVADGGFPYRIRLTQEGDIETLPEHKFARTAPINMNAHPKIDTETKEVFTFQLHIKYPYLTFFRSNRSGSNWKKVPIRSINHICFLHDFALTKQHAIFFNTQLEILLIYLLKCKGIPLSYQSTKVSQIGILPRYAISDSEMRWFKAPGLNAFHIVNSWEEGDQIVIITPRISSPDNLLYELGEQHMSLEKLIIDIKTGDITRKTLSDRSVEYGNINPAYQGKKNRYVYMAIHESHYNVSGVIKIDLELECEVATTYYGPSCFGGEALFVPRSDEMDLQYDEDDGFLLSYVHNETTVESYFVVMDAKSLEIRCKVKLPGRVPYGIHGIFLNEEQVNSF